MKRQNFPKKLKQAISYQLTANSYSEFVFFITKIRNLKEKNRHSLRRATPKLTIQGKK
jgi:hypothetical protein